MPYLPVRLVAEVARIWIHRTGEIGYKYGTFDANSRIRNRWVLVIMAETQFLRTILVLPVNSIEASTDWYHDALAFETVYLHEGDPGETANYAILRRESCEVHLILDEPAPHGAHWTKAGTGYLYLVVRNVEAVFEEVQSRGVKITRGLETENWGARGFNLTDPSGNAIHIENSE